jgi:serine/threonine-protein kinase
MIMGPAAYMSPEQALGKPADRRSDIFSFGAVMYEMLTGARAFKGEGAAETLIAIAKDDPDWSKLPAELPAAVDKLLRRCLFKDRKQRLQAIGEARIVLDEPAPVVPLGSGANPALTGGALPARLSWVVASVLALAAVTASWIAWRASRPVAQPLMQLSVDLGRAAAADTFVTAAISPDGTRIVYLVRAEDGKQQLATRLLSQSQATLLAETDGGGGPFFSPDGQWIGFFSSGKLKKVSLEGGAPITLCDAPNPRGASWGDDGYIVAALNNITGLFRVSAAGGKPQELTQLKNGEVTHRMPQVLPGSQAVLFTASTNLDLYEEANIELLSLKTGERTVALRGGYFGRYRATEGSHGYLFYVRGSVIYAAPFDPQRPAEHGPAASLIPELASDASTAGGQFDISGASGPGTLVYLGGKGIARGWPMAWLDSSAKTQPLLSTPSFYYTPRFSPDGKRLAIAEEGTVGLDIMVYDLQRDAKTRLTFSASENTYPAWTPDGKHIAFRTKKGVGWVRSDGAGEVQMLLETKSSIDPGAFSPDGRRLVYTELFPDTGFDLMTVTLDLSDPEHPKPGKPEVFLRTPFNERSAAISPDGRWIAYQSNESGGGFEIYVRPFSSSATGGKWQVSSGGGLYPMWSRSGRELFYETTNQQIMSAEYTAQGDSFSPGKPRLWSKARILPMTESMLDLAPDGKRIAAPPAREGGEDQQSSVHVNFVLNFFDEVRRRVPAGN